MKPILYKWAVCQHLTTKEQLDRGVRYFDFRIAKYEEKKKKKKNGRGKRDTKADYSEEQEIEDAVDIKILHALVGREVQEFIQDIEEFLKWVCVFYIFAGKLWIIL